CGIDAFSAQNISQPAKGEEKAGDGQKVDHDHPFGDGEAAAEFFQDGGQGDVDNAAVQRGHENTDGHEKENLPGTGLGRSCMHGKILGWGFSRTPREPTLRLMERWHRPKPLPLSMPTKGE